jgi:hypothetical protein
MPQRECVPSRLDWARSQVRGRSVGGAQSSGHERRRAGCRMSEGHWALHRAGLAAHPRPRDTGPRAGRVPVWVRIRNTSRRMGGERDSRDPAGSRGASPRRTRSGRESGGPAGRSLLVRCGRRPRRGGDERNRGGGERAGAPVLTSAPSNARVTLAPPPRLNQSRRPVRVSESHGAVALAALAFAGMRTSCSPVGGVPVFVLLVAVEFSEVVGGGDRPPSRAAGASPRRWKRSIRRLNFV